MNKRDIELVERYEAARLILSNVRQGAVVQSLSKKELKELVDICNRLGIGLSIRGLIKSHRMVSFTEILKNANL